MSLLAALVAELLALVTGQDWPSLLSATLYGLFFLRHWHSLLAYPRYLGLATLALLGLWLASAPPNLATTATRLASTFAYYASFVGALGLVQCLVGRLPQLADLHRVLLSGPPSLLYPRYLGCALLLGSVLSFGMLNLLCGTLQQRLQEQDVPEAVCRAGQRGVMVSALRGFALVPLLAPTSITMAIIARELPGLGWGSLLPYGALAATLLLMLGWRAENRRLRALLALQWSPRQQPWQGVLLAALLGGSLIALLAVFAPLSPSQAAMLVIPLGVAVGQLRRSSATATRDELSGTLGGMRNELFIFGCSALLGALAAQMVPLAGLAALLAERPALLHVLEAGVLLGSIVLAVLGVAPIVTLNLLAAMLAQLATFGAPPLGAAIALICGFSLAMLLSPFGPSALLLARLSGIPARRLSLGWNGRLALLCLPLLLLLPLLA